MLMEILKIIGKGQPEWEQKADDNELTQAGTKRDLTHWSMNPFHKLADLDQSGL